MSDEAPPEIEEEVQALEVRESQKPEKTIYSDEDKFIALAAVDLNAGNVYRTATALGIPASTLNDWVKSRMARQSNFVEGRKEKRGDLAAKVESLAHSLIEAMPGKVGKATLSQCAVAFGISVDKLRILRGQGLDPDPAAELCRLLNLNRSQLPERLELGPDDSIPPELFAGPVIETKSTPDGTYEPQPGQFIPEAHSPDCSISPDLPDSCSCGADDRNQAILKAQDEEPVN